MNSENDEEINGENLEKEKEGVISFSKINKYFFLPFLCPIFCMSGNICIDLTTKKGSNNSLFLIYIILCFSNILPGLLTFISSIRERTKNTMNDALIYKKDKNSNSVKLIYEQNYLEHKGKSKIVFFYLFIISLFTSIEYCFVNFNKDKHIIEIRLYLFIFICIFSKVILKQNIYKHQTVSLSISIIGFIFLCIFPIINFEKMIF